jgi:hypothetical protein
MKAAGKIFLYLWSQIIQPLRAAGIIFVLTIIQPLRAAGIIFVLTVILKCCTYRP